MYIHGLDKIFDDLGSDLFFLSITGGEPFMDIKHLIELIRHAKSKCPNLYRISINTNGYLCGNIEKVINYLLQMLFYVIRMKIFIMIT